MAIEAERLLAIFEARFGALEKGVEKARAAAAKAFDGIERDGKKTETALSRVGARGLPGMRKVEADLRSARAAIGQTTSAFNAMGSIRLFAGGIVGGLITRELKELSDTALRLQNSLKVAGLQGRELETVYAGLRDSALANAAPLESLVQLYGRAALVQKELGVSTADLLKFTDNIAVALRVSGASAQSASGALLQLSQALGGGTVRAEEFNSILEGAPAILQAAAAGLKEADGSVAKLRQIMLDGELSSRALFKAIDAGSDTLRDRLKTSVVTADQAFGNLRTALIDVATEFEKATGASSSFAGGVNNVAKAIGALDVEGFINKITKAGSALTKFLNDAGNAQIIKDFNERFGITQDGIPLRLETTESEQKVKDLRQQAVLLEEKMLSEKKLEIDTTATQRDLNAVYETLRAISAVATNPPALADLPGFRQPGGGGTGRGSRGSSLTPISIKDYPVGADAAGSRPQTMGGPARYAPGTVDLPAAVDQSPTRRVDPYFEDAGSAAGRAAATSFQTSLKRYLVKGQSESHVTGLDDAFAERLSAFLNAAPGGGISIYSGSRSYERQAQLFAAAVQKYGSVDAARKWVAPPGSSMHNKGGAADLRFADAGAKQWAHQNAGLFGLNFRMGHEPWHIEALKDGDSQQATLDGLRSSWEQLGATASDVSGVQAQQDAYAQFGDIATDAVGGLVDALSDGKLEGEELVQIIGRLVQQLLNMPAVQDWFSKLFSGGGSGASLGSMFGGGNPFVETGGGFRSLIGYASGTSFAPGGLSRINERGRGEIVDLPRGTRVIPHDVSMAMARNSGWQTVKISTVINNSAGAKVSQKSTPDGRGGIRQEIAIEQAVVRAMNRPGSEPNQMLEQRGARTPLVRR